MDVAQWLEDLGLSKYSALFREQAIDADVLPSLTDADFEKLGLPLGHRKKLLTAIAALEAAPSSTASVRRPSLAERRQLTVMIVDLVGSTSLSTRLDPEDMRETLTAYQDAVAGEIARFEGHLAKFMGDGVLAYFGWPRAHEDEAERAVAASLATVEAVGRLRSPDGHPLAARIGIATGLVVVGDLLGTGAAQEEAVVGDTPNLAARLQAVAGSGEVVVAEQTRRLLGGLFELEDLGPCELRGFGKPINAWRIVRTGAAESRFEALHTAGLNPLVGREQELGLLLERWHLAKNGEGQAMLLAGEAGIGKSRLIEALRERIADEPHTRISHRALPYHANTVLWPFIDQLERAAAFERDDTPPIRLSKLVSLLAQGTDDLTEAVPLIAALLGIPTDGRYPPLDLMPQTQKRKTLEVLLAQLEGLAQRRPVLSVLEDAHWFDPTSLELLELILERVQRLPVLAIITFRPEMTPPWPSFPHVTALTLNRLARRAAAALVEQTSGGRRLSPAVVNEIAAKTEGVPLFIEELTKTVLESGMLRNTPEGLAPVTSRGALAIPASLQDSLMARLDHLASAKDLVQVGAAIGREFTYELLDAVAGREPADLDQALARLVKSELVFQRGTPPEAVYTFKHALVQDVAYASLLKSRRSELHGRIAAILEARFADLVARQPELLAHHLTAAGHADRAIDFWLRAGQLAVGRSANREAISHLTTALEMLENRPPTDEQLCRELEVQIALGPPLTATKGFAAPEVETAHVRAEHLARRYGHRRHLARALRGLCYVNHVRGHIQRTSELCSELVDLAEQGEDPVMQADAHNALAFNLFHQGEHRSAREHLEISSAKIVQAGDPANALSRGVNIHVFGRAYRAHVDWHLGFADTALRSMQDAIDLAHRLVHPFSLAVALAYAAMLHQFRREPTEVRARAEAARSICTEHGFSYYEAWAAIMTGWAVAEEGDVEDGIERVRVGVRDLRATGAELRLPHYLGILADLYRRAQRLEDAIVNLAEARAVAERNEEHWADASLHVLEGNLALANGDQAEAERCFRRAMESAQAQSARALLLRASTRLARLLAAGDRKEQAYDELADIYGSFTEGFETVDHREARALLDGI
ncbi:AAA family ATPase [Bradyrhizobium sp. 157]|uniref:AAA family ATPase n=1 Tax=Bradyrhizobium sp. 157 TaxID=2782631 RepID=UPI001FFAAFF7|nr:adenylate/guanylate cyclase domain-containing protein [Bradyrhizobium sp. 157]MCK1639089.1 AAA family ATPase [Bradyrhizobium sp. 157]